MKEINDQALEGVIGGAQVCLPDSSAAKKREVCGRYLPREGKERETPLCSLCIHSSRNAFGEYKCNLDE